MSDWISVEDRLPPEGTWVIGATCLSPRTEHKKIISKELFFDGVNEHGVHWLYEGDWSYKVTHWQPLPLPPEEQ